MEIQARYVQVCLLACVRLVCQMNRLGVGGLLPLAAAELGFSAVQKASLLSAFPGGYLLTQIVGGAVADRLGGKRIIGLVLLSTALGSLAYSCASSFGLMWAVLFLMGLCQGPCFPAGGVLVARWVPSGEKEMATAVLEVGNPGGAVVGLCGMPLLAQFFGWRSVLAASGMATLAFAALWHALAADSPQECRYLSASEARKLQELARPGAAREPKPSAGLQAFARILPVKATWSVLFANVAFNYQRYFTYVWVAAYSTDMLKAPVSFAAACMFWSNLADIAFAIAVGKVADALAKSGRMSTLSIRRLFAAVGFLGTGVCLLLVSRTRDQSAVTLLVALATGLQACHVAGFKSSYTEISRVYSGVLSGLGNTFASLSSTAVPLVGAALLEMSGGSLDPEAWNFVFQTAFVAGVLGAALYCGLVSTESLDDKVAEPLQLPSLLQGGRCSSKQLRSPSASKPQARAIRTPASPRKERRAPLGLLLLTTLLHAAGFPAAKTWAPGFRARSAPAAPEPQIHRQLRLYSGRDVKPRR